MSAPQVRTPAAGPANAGDEEPNAAILLHGDAERKRFSGLQAAYAMAGFELLRCEDGALYGARWGLAKRLRDLDEAELFLQRIGGQKL